ncbi:ATP-binding cassette domain-containing protein [Pannus brasiliensis CCIBt3594]|uniref:ATP-binding cassette domain-containing protein n=1 Tax=Pannus brasiliensis CCIBt3594 TaxID=1427578 RepID=A0AAW9QNG6_9CHRO
MILDLQQVTLTVRRGTSHLLQDVTFSVERGERVGIIGASGAGKTSLLRLLNRLQDATTGEIFFEGKSNRQFPVGQLRREIVLVPQEPKLLELKVRESLVYPLELQKLPRREILDRLEHWTARIGIPEAWFDRTELQLSLGQRQLVSIARGLLLQPKILLLDEPTSALDVGTATRLFEVLANLPDLTIIMVNHQLEFVKTFADRVIYLQRGRVLENRVRSSIDWEEIRARLVASEQQNSIDEWED